MSDSLIPVESIEKRIFLVRGEKVMMDRHLDEVITICDDLKPLQFARTMPFAFTEHGVAMLSSVLSSDRAIHVNIEIIKAFVRLRRMLATRKALKKKIEEMEAKYDAQFQVVFEAIRQLIEVEEKPKKKNRILMSREGRMRRLQGCRGAVNVQGRTNAAAAGMQRSSE